jgi:hypothetical protein
MPVVSRTRFNSSQLVRCLAGLGVGGAEATTTVPERLGQWLDWTDAIALSGALSAAAQATPDNAVASPTAQQRAEAAVAAADRVRADLIRALEAGHAGAEDPDATPAERRRRHQALQRTMEMRLPPLRAELRTALAGLSPALAQLAALDAVLERALAARERHLLGTVPGWLERHDATTRHTALLAELDTRMQPIDGLLQTLRSALRTPTAPTGQPIP